MKTAGLFFLAASFALGGYFHGEEIRKAKLCMEELFRLIQHVRFEIEVFSRDQGGIYQKFSSPFFTRCGFLPLLIRETDLNPTGALYRCLRDFLPQFRLPNRWSEEILNWSESFGMRSRQKELEETGQLVIFLEKSLKEERENMKNRIRLSRTLGLTAGIGIFILLF